MLNSLTVFLNVGNYIRPDFLKERKPIEIYGCPNCKSNPYYVGLMVCGSVWVCAVCAFKIQALRALQVRAAIDAHVELGGSVWMVTQTVPHYLHNDLISLLNSFSKSFQAFKSGMTWVSIKDSFAISGYIKALEVTWSAQHGWHPHLHTIFFLDREQSEVDLKGLHSAMFAQWNRCTSRNGFAELSPKAFSIQDASKVKEYLNKMTGERYLWSSEHELTKLHTKKGRNNSFVPYDFLRAYRETRDILYANLFETYSQAFHGKLHLTWSRGLKARYLITDQSDEDLAGEIGEEDVFLAMLDFWQWSALRRLKGVRWRGEILQVVKEFGKEGLEHYLEGHGICSSIF